MRTYTIRPDEKIEAWFTLHLFTTRKQMLAYASAWRKRRQLPPENFVGTAGLVTSAGSKEFPVEGRDRWYSTTWATMFLNDEDLRRNRQEIIAHEALHCALAHERHVQHYCMNYHDADGGIEDEERLCYLHGRIVAGVYTALAKDKPPSARRNRARKGNPNGRKGT